MARDLRVAVLEVSAASTVYSREAEDCKLADLAAKWAVTRVRCFALDKESIQIAVRLQTCLQDARGLRTSLRWRPTAASAAAAAAAALRSPRSRRRGGGGGGGPACS